MNNTKPFNCLLLVSALAALAFGRPAAAADFRPPAVPLVTYNPFLSMWIEIARKTDRGQVIHPEEKITRAEALISRGTRVVGVRTSAGEIHAGHVVCAAGSGIPALTAGVGVQVPLDLARGQMFVTERIPPLLRTYVHNIKQTPAGTIVFGTTREPGVKNTTVTSVEGTHKMLKWASSLVPALANVKLLRSWAGLRLLPPDGYPIIGKPDGVEGLVLAVLHRGVTLAPIVGKVVTDLVTDGKTPHDISPYRLSRFAPAAVGTEARETFYGG